MSVPPSLHVPLPAVPPDVLTDGDAERLAAYVAQAVAEATHDWLMETRVKRTVDEHKPRIGYDGALGKCMEHGVSPRTARRILEGKWPRQPENRRV